MVSMAYVVFLCLSVCVASIHGGMDGTDILDREREPVKESLSASEGEEQVQNVDDASPHIQQLTQLIHRMILFSHALNHSDTQLEDGGEDDDNVQKVNKGLTQLIHRMTLFSHGLNLSRTLREDEGDDGDSEQRVREGLAQLVYKMTLLSKALTRDPTQLLAPSTGVLSSPPASMPAPRHQPCLPPFDQIAYRMCILQEMELKLTWSDAQEFCREHGAKLAQDMTVIKMRRLLNDLYGEEGTRSRWPVWVGARRGREQWQWSGLAEGSGVSSFLWAPNEPRVYSSDLLPEGACMILDGYRRFHAASLPCHLRRRFVCEL